MVLRYPNDDYNNIYTHYNKGRTYVLHGLKDSNMSCSLYQDEVEKIICKLYCKRLFFNGI